VSTPTIDKLPGFRRRFRITPLPGEVCCEVEDDIHCMVVVVYHDGVTASKVEAKMRRAPWTTCPGAEQELKETFSGVKLKDFPSRGKKKANCTHLYDLAILAANHAKDDSVTVFDLLVSDPDEGGKRVAELRNGKKTILILADENNSFTEPVDLAGMPLMGNLEPWLGSLTPSLREAARMLRWTMLVAHGRTMPFEEQSEATKLPPNCYTLQPERAVLANRVGIIKDFSDGTVEPLEGFNPVL